MMYFNVWYVTSILVLFLSSLLYICVFAFLNVTKTFVYFSFFFAIFFIILFFGFFLLLVYKLHLRKAVACHSINDGQTDEVSLHDNVNWCRKLF